jgi:hypothetical protein
VRADVSTDSRDSDGEHSWFANRALDTSGRGQSRTSCHNRATVGPLKINDFACSSRTAVAREWPPVPAANRIGHVQSGRRGCAYQVEYSLLAQRWQVVYRRDGIFDEA